MEKVWLKSYEPGVPEFIDPDKTPSLVTIAEESFLKYQTKPCYSNMGVTIDYAKLDFLSKAFAGFLQAKCALNEQDRVAIMMPNLLQYPVALFGALRANMTVVNINPLYTARELKHVLNDSGAKVIVVLANFANTVEKVVKDTQVEKVVVTEIGDLFGCLKGCLVNFVVKYIKKMVPPFNIPADLLVNFKDVMSIENADCFKPTNVTGEDIAFLQYTGGTTGDAKGAILTHRNMVANVTQASAWIDRFMQQELKGGIITALPLYHIFSLTANCLTFLKAGVCNILITNPRDIPGFIKELKRQSFSVMTGVNTLFNALLHNKEFKNLDFSNFKFTLGGGMAVQKWVAEEWKRVTGVPLLEAYGLTESSPAVTINPMNLAGYNGSIGLPISSTEIKIIDENGSELGINEPGELCVRGPQVMRGYWNNQAMTDEVIKDGWLLTGDIAKVDDNGFVYIVDRKKDMILVSGFNVYPNEVEDVIVSMPEVKEVAVVGVKDQERGELVKAFVVLNDKSLTKEQIIAHCRKELTAYKVPKLIEFKDELPKTNVGKVLRRALRD